MYTFSIRPYVLAATLFAGTISGFAQDNLVNSLKVNASDNSKASFQFTEVINLQNTSVKNQGSSRTC